MAVDRARLPASLLFDTTVIVAALRRKAGDEHSAELWDAMINARNTIYIATPSLAEYLRKAKTTPIPITPNVIVVPFDAIAARVLGLQFPKDTLVRARDAEGGPLDYFKFDAMILAVAARLSVGIVTLDTKRQTRMAVAAQIDASVPSAYQARQVVMPFPATPPVVPSKPASKPNG